MDTVALILLIGAAAVVRMIFYTGFFGSDEVVYNAQALALLHGDWQASDYIGAVRYGINLPVAAFLALFGVNELSANLWSLLCSLGEVILVYVLARRFWGWKVGIYAAVLLAFLPLHVHYAGRMMADAPLAFFITLAFVLFILGEDRGKKSGAYFGAGVALGFAYWIKSSVAILTVPVFLAYAVLRRRWVNQWLWAIAGGFLMLALNMALMWVLSGDPLHVFTVDSGAVQKVIDNSAKVYTPTYYFQYLFVNVQHTWLLGILFVWGGWRYWSNKTDSSWGCGDTLLLWVLGLLAMLSFTVVSISPFAWIFKQTNYMLIFSAPMAVLAAYGLAQLNKTALVTVLLLYVGGGIVLSALEQQAVRAFSSNSKATVEFSKGKDVPVYASSHAVVISEAESQFSGEWPVRRSLVRISELAQDWSAAVNWKGAYVVLDQETMDWGGRNPKIDVSRVPRCWVGEGVLSPVGFGVGKQVLLFLDSVADVILPASLMQAVTGRMQSLLAPKPAYVFRVPKSCGFDASWANTVAE